MNRFDLKKARRQSLLAAMLAALFTVPAWSAEEPESPSGGYGAEEPMVDQSQVPQQPQAPEASEAPQQPLAQQGSAEQALRDLRPADLEGLEVMGIDGKPVGEIVEVVSDRDSGQVNVVIAVGGILGFGAKEYTTSLDELRQEQGKLYVSATQGELTAQQEYVKERYIKVEPEDRPISEFSAFEELSQ